MMEKENHGSSIKACRVPVPVTGRDSPDLHHSPARQATEAGAQRG